MESGRGDLGFHGDLEAQFLQPSDVVVAQSCRTNLVEVVTAQFAIGDTIRSIVDTLSVSHLVSTKSDQAHRGLGRLSAAPASRTSDAGQRVCLLPLNALLAHIPVAQTMGASSGGRLLLDGGGTKLVDHVGA